MYEIFVNFVKSDLGVAISWACGVAGFIYGFIQRREVSRIKIKLHSVVANNEMQQKSGDASLTDGGGDSVNLSGEKNVYTKNNSGGINIKM